MKKINNRQNQVKSLDFSNNTHILYNQSALQKSPQIVKGIINQNPQIVSNSSKNALQLAQKETGSASGGQFVKSNNHHQVMMVPTTAQNLAQQRLFMHNVNQESTHSFKNSPIKGDIIIPSTHQLQQKSTSSGVNYTQSVQKTQSHKAQKIKVGLHKKTVSLIGQNQIQALIQPNDTSPVLFEYAKAKNTTHFNQSSSLSSHGGGINQHPTPQILKNPKFIHATNSQMVAAAQSAQNSFNDYNSNNTVTAGGVPMHSSGTYTDMKQHLPKVDNFIDLGSSTNSGGTSQSKIKQYSQLHQQDHFLQHAVDPHIINLPKYSVGSVGSNHSGMATTSGGMVIMGDLTSQGATPNSINLKSYDQRPPMSQFLINNQSQRMSIVSSQDGSVKQGGKSTQQHSNDPGYRSHANSFKQTSQSVAMKYPNGGKYLKASGPSNTTYQQNQIDPLSQGKKKKTLQYHHQRTFSDNPQSFSNNSRTQLYNPSGAGTAQISNKNFQELLRASGDNDQFINTIAVTSDPNQYQLMKSFGLSNPLSYQNNQAAKTTLGSSRQSAHSQTLGDDRDIIINYYNHNPNVQFLQDQQDQIKKTKQVIKLTQQQFGGPSRKVVQGSKLGSNTQSYRGVTQNSIKAQSISKINFGGGANDLKATPKTHYIQKVSGSKKSSKATSQNNSSHGARGSTNTTQIALGGAGNTQLIHADKVIPKKKSQGGNKFDQSSSSIGGTQININLTSGAISDMIAITKKKEGVAAGHKRSISDGNQIFQIMSNRINPAGGMQQTQQQKVIKQGLKSSIDASSLRSSETYSNTYQKQQSLQKLLQGTHGPSAGSGPYNIIDNRSPNDYQVVLSERQQVKKANEQTIPVQSIQNNTITSHRVVNGLEIKHGHHRQYSHQMSIDQDRNLQPTQLQQMIPQGQLIQKKPSSSSASQRAQLIVKPSAITQGKPNVRQVSEDMTIEDQATGIKNPSMSNPKSKMITLNPASEPPQPMSLLQNEKAIRTPITGFSGGTMMLGLKTVEERIETQESAVSDPNLTPKTKLKTKLQRRIKLAFQKTNNPPVTSTEFYKIGKVMGKGAFGKVNLAIHRLSEKFVALKSINKEFLSEEASKRKVMQEFNILRRTRHRNVVRLYESFETAQHIVFVMEVCGAGDLLTYVRRRRKLKEDVGKHLFRQICEGLKYIHSKSILHRDIKLDNILLTSEGDIKICDFGVSKIVRAGEIMTEQCGTPAYIAPEVFENKGYEGYASDVWSAGVVLYAMLYGTVPFKAGNMTELQKQITKCQTTFKEEISSEAISLLKGILERDPAKRLSINDILRHPWMQSDSTDKINVFTDQEKQKVIQEFAYYNFKGGDGAGDDGILPTDPFTEQMLNSTENSLVKNASTKSVILAPFNSTRSHIDDNHHMRQSIQNLLIDKKNLKFAAKCKEIDRQYEANNNAELDNGVYHQDSEEEKKDDSPSKKKVTSIETSFDNGKAHGDIDDDGQLASEIEEGQKRKKQSEWQKLEQMVIDRQKTEEEEDEQHVKGVSHGQMLGSAQTLVIDDRFVFEIEKCGYPRQYLINSLNNDDLNYATTFYYLLNTTKEY